MIKTNDLRRLNWIETPDGYKQVCYINIMSVMCLQGVKRYDEKVINGISLSPELLTEKCGVAKDGFNCFNFDINVHPGQFRFIVVDLWQGYAWIREGEEEWNRVKDHIVCVWNRDMVKDYYLHQLQNLYYLLTGKELPLTM